MGVFHVIMSCLIPALSIFLDQCWSLYSCKKKKKEGGEKKALGLYIWILPGFSSEMHLSVSQEEWDVRAAIFKLTKRERNSHFLHQWMEKSPLSCFTALLSWSRAFWVLRCHLDLGRNIFPRGSSSSSYRGLGLLILIKGVCARLGSNHSKYRCVFCLFKGYKHVQNTKRPGR